MTDQPHYHIWIRTGRVFTMRSKKHNTRPGARKEAMKLRSDPADWMVKVCHGCIESAPSRKRSRKASNERDIIKLMAVELGIRESKVSAAFRRAKERVAIWNWEKDYRDRLAAAPKPQKPGRKPKTQDAAPALAQATT